MHKVHSIRIPVHGFIEFDDWERDIIGHPVFQRLRRIRQLALADHVYPGATHTRFEHSLGVMHTATRLYDAIIGRFEPILEAHLNLDPGKSNTRRLVRLAALLHDVGHAPFSHTGEDLMPIGRDGVRFRHEDYSAALIEHELADVLTNHPINRQQHNLSAEYVAQFLRADPKLPAEVLFWRELIDGQLDADRMDYLLRDSMHCGVTYGHFDLDRIVDTIAVVKNHSPDLPNDLRIAIAEGGRHAAEGLIFARYFMFQQVYFHPVRIAYNKHVERSLARYLRKCLGSTVLPNPLSSDGRRKFLDLDDWRVAEFILQLPKDPDAYAILHHAHDRKIHQTSEQPTPEEIRVFKEIAKTLRKQGVNNWERDAGNDWYTPDDTQVQIAPGQRSPLEVPVGTPLSQLSAAICGLTPTRRRYLFVGKDVEREAKTTVERLTRR